MTKFPRRWFRRPPGLAKPGAIGTTCFDGLSAQWHMRQYSASFSEELTEQAARASSEDVNV